MRILHFLIVEHQCSSVHDGIAQLIYEVPLILLDIIFPDWFSRRLANVVPGVEVHGSVSAQADQLGLIGRVSVAEQSISVVGFQHASSSAVPTEITHLSLDQLLTPILSPSNDGQHAEAGDVGAARKPSGASGVFNVVNDDIGASKYSSIGRISHSLGVRRVVNVDFIHLKTAFLKFKLRPFLWKDVEGGVKCKTALQVTRIFTFAVADPPTMRTWLSSTSTQAGLFLWKGSGSVSSQLWVEASKSCTRSVVWSAPKTVQAWTVQPHLNKLKQRHCFENEKGFICALLL